MWIFDRAWSAPLPLREREGPVAERREGEGAAAVIHLMLHQPPCVFGICHSDGGAVPGHDPAPRCGREPVASLVCSPWVSLVPRPRLPSPNSCPGIDPEPARKGYEDATVRAESRSRLQRGPAR